MKKWIGRLAFAGLCFIAIATLTFLALIGVNVDCDGYACVGYFIILGALFLLGLALMIIAAFVGLGSYVYSLLKKVDNE